jgi:tRNA/tmRNA/rRNA uracil-C5-methylase (TrmA/RlmC/RlmD family)
MSRTVEVSIEDIAFGGKGVGRVDGKALFVPFTIEGEKVAAHVVREKKSFAEGELVRLLESSPQRVAPQCPYFGRCGGCAYQHMSYERQLHWKARQVAQALERIGKLHEPPMRPIVRSPREFSYRNRITVHVEDGTIGFFRRDEHRLIDIARCPISAPEVNAELAALRAKRPRDGHYTLRAQPGPRVFYQTNDEVAALLADAIAALIPPRQSLLIDAYCGAGFFAKRLRESFARVIGIDWDIHAIAAARATATAKESYLAGDIAEHLRQQLGQAELSLTTLIVDPPAAGLGAEVREILRAYPLATVLYVSCNPPTLARDLADLAPSFTLRSVTPFDMFPQTAEIEVLAYLSKSEPPLRSGDSFPAP